MEMLLGLIGLVILVVVYLRRFLLRKDVEPAQRVPFRGELYPVGGATLSRQRSGNPKQSVVVVHGFVENFLYFTRYYDQPDLELVGVTCSGYNLPVEAPRFSSVDWTKTPEPPVGTIAHDAQVLILALEHLVSTDTVRVHGHSRGGAVVMEAARLRPDLFERVEVILEAPVLPQGRPYAPMPGWFIWFLPFYLSAWQQNPINERNRSMWGPLDDPYKRSLVMGYPFNGRRASVLMTNLRDMNRWMREEDAHLFANLQRGAILVPERDKVLHPGAMLAAASQAQNLQIIEVPEGTHFVIFDNPERVPPLPEV
ncbi:alpha/beta fold hydrolase [Pseudomonas sp.]|uniref:alpha/beta fold hydrolase n=1 Tax=Pseudomonas sp. TaxID=306 RepID=UPI00272A3004|nr:alpha/beta hydrolase [Pseudomonas sp.]